MSPSGVARKSHAAASSKARPGKAAVTSLRDADAKHSEEAATTAISSSFPVVGVGASAGGLAAVTELLKHLPPALGAAIVVIQHLDPKHGSLTTEILSRVSSMPVAEVRDGMRAQHGHVYVIPPNRNMTLSRGVLKLSPRSEARGQHLPIDLFFKSLAEDRKDRAVGVVLSGIASDGTMGVQEIKAKGGFTFAQDPTSAQYDGMPRNAILSGAVDIVETPQGIAREIAKISLLSLGRPAGSSAVESALPLPRGPNGNLRKIFALIRNATGVDLTHYKQSTIQRRIARRLLLLKIENLQTYAAYLESDPEEVKALFADTLIHVTSFFRDPDAYETLKTRILPQCMKNWDFDIPFRVWVPGCSSGEEAYSIAIAFFEYLAKSKARPRLQIFASDVSEASLQKARSATYPESLVRNVSKARLNRFFERTEGGRYRIAKWIRDTCLFSRHDLTADPPFGKIDLIACRNVLIYFAPELQRRIVPILHYALNPGGRLWLGDSEAISGFGNLFTMEDRIHKFYSRNTIATPLNLQFPPSRMPLESLARRKFPNSPATLQDVQAEADRVAIQQFAPPGVVVNDAAEILQVRGRPAPFLELAPGQATMNLFKLAHPEIVADLRYLFHSVRRENKAARRDGLTLRKNGQRRNLGITVVPLRLSSTSKERYFQIFFEETPGLTELRKPPAKDRGKSLKTSKPRTEQQRQDDLDEGRYQQELISEYEATQEEFVSSNEELQSTNEELQSTNEELQTAKEELQSANEEMITINDELQNRNAEMAQLTETLTIARDDARRIIETMPNPILVIAFDWRVQGANDAFCSMFQVERSEAEGRFLSELCGGHWSIPSLMENVATVFREGVPFHDFEIEHDFPRIGRIDMILHATATRLAGAGTNTALLAIEDLTARKRTAEQLRQTEERYRHLLENANDGIVIVNGNAIEFSNHRLEVMFGYSPGELNSQNFEILIPGQYLEIHRNDHKAFSRLPESQDTSRGIDIYGKRKDGTTFPVEVTLSPLRSDANGMVTAIVRDISERKRIELERQDLLLREKAARMDAEKATKVKDEFLTTLSHELRTPLTAILSWVQLLRLGKIDPEKAKTAVSAIEKSAKDQGQLIDDLLDVSRIQAGRMHLELCEIEPIECIATGLESVRNLAENKSITIQTEFDPSPCRVIADSGRLQQVFRNLFTNAVKFTPPGGTITVRTGQKKDPERLEIQLEDTGKGFKPEFLPHLFTPFSQEDSSVKRVFGGLGLGLSIVRNLAEMHGGTVTASSPGEGKGAVFTVTLPCAENRLSGDARRSHAKSHTNAKRTAKPADLTGLRVLVIDDLEDTRDAFSVMLESFGAQVETAVTAGQGLAVLEKFKPDVALCDIAMPEEDGFSFIKKVRALKPSQGGQTPSVALTAFAGAEHVRTSLEAGFDAHLAKPVDAVDLSRLIAKLARHSEKKHAHNSVGGR